MEINILYALTSDMYDMTFTSLYSLFKNNKRHKINLILVHDENYESSYIQNIAEFEKKKNCKKISFFKVDSQKYAKYANFQNMLYCLEIPNLTKKNKILYILNSTIINCDLSKLYSIDLTNHSIAAAESPAPEYILMDSNIIHNDFIFTPHIMLINLDLWRKENYSETLDEKLPTIESRKKPLNCNEIFNILTKDCLKLPQDYAYCENGRNPIEEFYCCEETADRYIKFKNHEKTPKIIVYCYPHPIYEDCNHTYLKTWWDYAINTPYFDKIISSIQPDFIKYPLQSIKILINKFKSSQVYVNYSRIFPYVKPYWFRALLSVLICIPIGSLDAVIALSLKPYMDLVMVEKSVTSPWYIPVGIVLFTCLQGFLNYIATYLNTWVGGKITNDLKFTLYKKMLTLEAAYFDKKKSGDIVFRFNNDADMACNGFLENLKTFTSRIFSSLSLTAVLFYNSWQLALIAVIVLGGAFLPLANIRKRIKSVMDKTVTATSAVITAYNESFAGNKTISSYNLENLQENKFKNILSNIFTLKIKYVQRTSWLSPMMHIIVSIGIGLAIGYGSHLILTGKITSGNFVSFITALIMLYTPVKSLGNNFNAVQMSFLAIERVFAILEIIPKIKDSDNAITLKEVKNDILFENVCFEYIKNKPVLKNISLEIKKGETIAFVGNSGGGKSSIVSLIPRFYDIKSGSIKFDGIDIRNYTLDSLRQNIAVVFQDNFLFSGTIKENILLGNQKATDEQVKKAIKMAYLDEFVFSLKDGWDTQIGERGMLLSGGQKQRVAIARAFIKNAPIIILDEATSALDNKSEAVVQKAIANLMKDKTVFVIAHRLSTIQNANKIAVINEGELVELGSHEDLMQIENGQYKALYDMQFKKQEV